MGNVNSKERKDPTPSVVPRGLLVLRPDIGMLLLDEINVAIRLGQLPLEDVLQALQRKREMLHAVLTGRGAPPELIELADLVTEMRMVKHPYRAGIKAQKGIEF